MLNGIHLVDFGNHRNTRLTFGPMTALVGQNGSGKTTVMRAIRAIQTPLSEGVRGTIQESNIRRGCQDVCVAAGRQEYSSETASDFGVIVVRGGASFFRRPRDSDEDLWLPDPSKATGQGPIAARRPRDRWTCSYFKTNGATLQGPSYSEENPPTLKDDGSDLAWTLAYLMTAEPERLERILTALQNIVPIVRRIRARPVAVDRIDRRMVTIEGQLHPIDQRRTVMGQELIFDMKSGNDLSAAAISEGTLVALAVLTLIHGSDADLVMLDDVELGLHPKAQRDLIRQLRRIQETHPKLQILVSTHSPYVVDEFKAEDVWVFAPDKEGCAVAKRLSEHPDAKRALEVLTTGEFWSAEGEPWVLDEEPASRVAEEPNA